MHTSNTEAQLDDALESTSGQIMNQLMIQTMLDTCIEELNPTKQRLTTAQDPQIYNCFLKFMQGVGRRPMNHWCIHFSQANIMFKYGIGLI